MVQETYSEMKARHQRERQEFRSKYQAEHPVEKASQPEPQKRLSMFGKEEEPAV